MTHTIEGKRGRVASAKLGACVTHVCVTHIGCVTHRMCDTYSNDLCHKRVREQIGSVVSTYVNMNIHIYTYICLHTLVYMQREREKERKRESERKREPIHTTRNPASTSGSTHLNQIARPFPKPCIINTTNFCASSAPPPIPAPTSRVRIE